MPREPRNDLTAEFVRSILSYDPETGVFRWKWRDDWPRETNSRLAGKIAGTKIKGRRVQININGHIYLASRIAYLIMKGEWPPFEIDHENTDDCDNRWNNLRPATHRQNTFNRGIYSTNTSGFPGVSWNSKDKNWQVHVWKYDKQIRIGGFKNFNDAVAARINAVREYYGEEFSHKDMLNYKD